LLLQASAAIVPARTVDLNHAFVAFIAHLGAGNSNGSAKNFEHVAGASAHSVEIGGRESSNGVADVFDTGFGNTESEVGIHSVTGATGATYGWTGGDARPSTRKLVATNQSLGQIHRVLLLRRGFLRRNGTSGCVIFEVSQSDHPHIGAKSRPEGQP
jgi:hypothetical protein